MFWQDSRTIFLLKCLCYLSEHFGSAYNWHLRFSCHHNNGLWGKWHATPPSTAGRPGLPTPQEVPVTRRGDARSSGRDARPMRATRTCQAVSCCARRFDLGATNPVVGVVEGGRPRVISSSEESLADLAGVPLGTLYEWLHPNCPSRRHQPLLSSHLPCLCRRMPGSPASSLSATCFASSVVFNYLRGTSPPILIPPGLLRARGCP